MFIKDTMRCSDNNKFTFSKNYKEPMGFDVIAKFEIDAKQSISPFIQLFIYHRP